MPLSVNTGDTLPKTLLQSRSAHFLKRC